MKVLHYITLFTLLLTVKGYAQQGGGKGPVVHFGGKFGGTLTKTTAQDIEGKRKWGYQVGGYVTVDLVPNLGIQGEALYNRNVFLLVTPENTDKQKTIVKTWNFPVLLRLNAGEAFTFNIGPQFSHVISSKGYQPEGRSGTFDKSHVSFVTGIELGSRNTGGRLYARYNWNNKDFSGVVKDAKANQFQFGLLLPIL